MLQLWSETTCDNVTPHRLLVHRSYTSVGLHKSVMPVSQHYITSRSSSVSITKLLSRDISVTAVLFVFRRFSLGTTRCLQNLILKIHVTTEKCRVIQSTQQRTNLERNFTEQKLTRNKKDKILNKQSYLLILITFMVTEAFVTCKICKILSCFIIMTQLNYDSERKFS